MPEGSSRKPSKTPGAGVQRDEFAAVLGKPGVVQDAEVAKIVWARVKGYPWWPAQVLSKAAARQHLGGITHKSKSDAPVIFFGTSEIAWIGAKDVTYWGSGMEQSFHSKGRKNKKFVVALEQVRDFLSLTTDRVAPHGWWCAPPTRGARAATEDPATSDDEDAEQQCYGSGAFARAAGGTAATGASVPVTDGHMHAQQQLQQGSALEEHGSQLTNRTGQDRAGGGQIAAAQDLSADDTADLQEAAAAAAAVMQRSMNGLHRISNGHAVDSMAQHSTGLRKSACQQIWGGGGGSLSRHQSSDGAAEQQQALGRHQRKRQATRQLYDTGSEGSESDGSESDGSEAMAGRARTQHMRGAGQQHSGSRGKSSTGMAAVAAAAAAAAAVEEAGGYQAVAAVDVKRRRLLQPKLDATGSDSEATDMESLALAAMAMAQLASGAEDWQRSAAQQQAQASAHMDLDQADGRADVITQDSAQGPASTLKVGSVTVGPPAVSRALHPAAAVPPTAVYEHGGQGLPCPQSWQYAVRMPSSDEKQSAAGELSSGHAAAQPAMNSIPAAAVAPLCTYYTQLYASFAAHAAAGSGPEDTDVHRQSSGGEEALELSTADGAAAHMEGSAGLQGMDSSDARVAVLAALQAPAALSNQPNSAGGTDTKQEPVVQYAPGAVQDNLRTATNTSAASKPQLRSAEWHQQIAAATAAICAAFTATAPGTVHAAGGQAPRHQQHLQNGQCLHHQHNSCSAAASERSAGSSVQRVTATSNSFSSKRRHAATAAAAALAASHVLTPPHPALDAQVAALLLGPEGPRLPHQQGLPDTGFRLPRSLLLNRAPKYEALRRNVYVSRERPKRLAKHDVHVCNCRPRRISRPDGTELVVGCTEGCLNRLSFIHCDPRTCPCGTACTNKPFHMLKAPVLDVFLTDNRGHGVRPLQSLDRGHFVVEYAGEVIDQAELQRRMDAARDSGEQHFYIMELAPGLYIDAKRKGNHARLLNSSCDPNCVTQKWRDAATGEVRIGIFTTRPVSELEELTYDYMFEHSGVGALAHGFRCMCGSKNCRGTMDINPDRKRDWGRRVEVFWEGDGVFYRGTVTGFSTNTGKHTVMYDDGDVERVKLCEVPHRWLDGDASPHSSAQGAAGSPAPRSGYHITAAGDSGSWSQTEQEISLDDGSGPAAPAGCSIGGRMGKPAVGASPLRPAAPVTAAQAAGVDDAVVAADALVTLGLAAEAELEQQQQPRQPSSQLDAFARPADKKLPMDSWHAQANGMVQHQQHMHPGLVRAQQQWQHSSSSSQSAGGCYGVAGGLDGQSPISPPGHRGSNMLGPLSSQGASGASGMGLPQSGLKNGSQAQLQARQLSQQQQQQTRGVPGCRAPRSLAASMDSSQGEFLPWEQLLSGIQAIKSQGPPLFVKSCRPARGQRGQQKGQAAHAAASHCSVGSKFGRLLDLVGKAQPKTDQQPLQSQHQQPLLQQQLLQMQAQAQLKQQPLQQQNWCLGQPSSSESWGGSSTTSTASNQLPLFCAVNSHLQALLLQQPAQQLLQPLMQQQLLNAHVARQLQAQQQQQHAKSMAPPAAIVPRSHAPHTSARTSNGVEQQTAVPTSPAVVPVSVPAAAHASQPKQPVLATAVTEAMQRAPTSASCTKASPLPSAVDTAQEKQQQQPLQQVSVDVCKLSAAADEVVPASVPATHHRPPCEAPVHLHSTSSVAQEQQNGAGPMLVSAAAAAAAASGALAALPQPTGLVDTRQAQAVAQ